MKKKYKLWVVLLSVVVGFFVVLTGTYFTTKLKTVSVEFRARLDESRLSAGVLDRVKDSAEFDYKKSVLFINTQKNIDKIEKSNPYVKVQQIIRKFPNKICVYISERIPKYRIVDSKDSSTWFILDEDFKVLQSMTNNDLLLENLDDKTIEIKHISENINVGEFLNKNTDRNNLNALMSGVFGRTKDYFAVRSIDFSSEENKFYLTMRTTVETDDGEINYSGGCIIEIKNVGNLKEKALKGTCAYVGDESLIDGRDLTQKQVIVVDENDCIIKNQG